MSKYNNWETWEKEIKKERERRIRIAAYILIPILFISAMVGLGFGLGWMDVAYKNTVGVASASADRNVFKENKIYVEGMISDLAKYKYEITVENDLVAKKAIAELIIGKYANFDVSKIEDASLVRFLQDVKNGKYNNLEGK